MHACVSFKTHSHVSVFPDPQVKVVGLPVNIQRARELILADLDAKSTRVTLKIDVPFAEHSHVIGKEGANIKKGEGLKWPLQYLVLALPFVHVQHMLYIRHVYHFPAAECVCVCPKVNPL